MSERQTYVLPSAITEGDPATEQWRKRAKYVAKVLGAAAFAALPAHIGGVTATTIAPVHIETTNYAADVSLAYTKFDQAIVPSAFGDVSFGFDSKVPTPAIVAQPKLRPQIMDSYAKEGLDGLSVSEQQIRDNLETLAVQLGERYALGAGLAMLLAYGLYAGGSRRLPRTAAAVAVAATGLSLAYEGGSAATTYSADSYRSYQIDGLAGSLRGQGESMIDSLDKRSSQIQPYIASWVALRNDLAKAITPERGERPGEGPRFLLVSDIHNINLYPMLRQIIIDEKITAVIDTGDIVNQGYPQEGEAAGIFDGIESLGVPYLFVQGNHDKSSRHDTTLIERMSQIPNVTVLQPGVDQFTVAHVGDLTIAGVNDYMRWYGDDNKNNAAKQKPVVEWFNKTFANQPPDIAVSHEPAASSNLINTGLTLAGHMHRDEVNGNHITNGTLTGGGIFGQNDSIDVKDVSSVQSYGILSFDSSCLPSRLDVSRFHGMFEGKPKLDSVAFYFFNKDQTKESGEAPRDCSDKTFRTSTLTTPRDVAR